MVKLYKLKIKSYHFRITHFRPSVVVHIEFERK